MKILRPDNIPADYKPNGCGPSGWKGDLVPDTLGGIDISEACNIHDYMYYVGGTEEDKELADRYFLINMLTIIHRDDTWYTNESIAIKWATNYYVAVVQCGNDYFNYKGK